MCTVYIVRSVLSHTDSNSGSEPKAAVDWNTAMLWAAALLPPTFTPTCLGKGPAQYYCSSAECLWLPRRHPSQRSSLPPNKKQVREGISFSVFFFSFLEKFVAVYLPALMTCEEVAASETALRLKDVCSVPSVHLCTWIITHSTPCLICL